MFKRALPLLSLSLTLACAVPADPGGGGGSTTDDAGGGTPPKVDAGGKGGKAGGGGGESGAGGASNGGASGGGGEGGGNAYPDASVTPDAADTVVDAGAMPDPNSGSVGGQLHGAFMEMDCPAATTQLFCKPKEGHADQKLMLKFGGEAGKTYDVVLKVWGILERIAFKGGTGSGNFYTGGMSGTANYAPWGLKVGEQQYWFNSFPTGGGDQVAKIQYSTPAIKIPGGATVLLTAFDPNNHMTTNTKQKLVIDNPPAALLAKIKQQPVQGNFLYLEVESAKAN